LRERSPSEKVEEGGGRIAGSNSPGNPTREEEGEEGSRDEGSKGAGSDSV